MWRRFCQLGTRVRLGCWLGLLTATVCLGVLGCKGMNLRGEGFPDETAPPWEELRAPEKNSEFFGFSNKARQIERDVGIGDRDR